MSSAVTSAPSKTSFQTNLPVTNFPLSVSSDSYRSGHGSLSLTPNNPDDDDFSEDSLLECEAENPGKRKRVSKRLEELAQQIQDRDDSLANIDSIALSSRHEKTSSPRDPSLNLIDSLNPEEWAVSPTVTETDSLEFSPASVNRQNLEKKISDINAQIKEIETRQLLSDLENLEKEIMSVSVTSPNPKSPDPGSRPKWMVTDIEIACDDLTGNSVMSYSYENGGFLGSRRESVVSQDSSLAGVTDLAMDPPMPRRATLPSPVPNLSRLASAKKLSSNPRGPSGPTRPLVEHSGAVGVTSMWIPASNTLSDMSPVSPMMSLSTSKPKIHRGGASHTSKTPGQRTNIRDNGSLGKKLQIQNVLPNKQRAEGI